jgi:muramoyltetrapeptide carboxypeptidase
LALSDVDSYLADFYNAGAFDNVAGLIIGRSYNYSKEEATGLKEIVTGYASGKNYPILANVNIGHVDSIITLPYGSRVTLDSTENIFSFER